MPMEELLELTNIDSSEITEPLKKRLIEAFNLFVKTVKARLVYPASSRLPQQFKEELFVRITGLCEELDAIIFRIEADRIFYGELEVYRAPNKADNFAHVFFRDGILSFQVKQGIHEKELETLIEASLRNRTFKILALVALGLTVVSGLLAYFLKPALWGGAGFGLILLFFSIFKLFAQKSQRYFYSQQIEQKKIRLQELEKDFYELTTSAKNILSNYNLVSSQVLRENYDHYRDIEREIKNELSRYEGWLGGRNARDLENELKDVTRELALWDEKTRDLKPFVLKREELIQLQNEVREIEEKRKNLEIKTIALKKELEMAECGAELEASLEERLDYTRKSLMELQKGLEIYEIIQGTLEEARRKVIDTCVGTLEEETSKLLKEMTAGKYSQVRFDKESFRFEVFSDKLKNWVDPQKYLSRGTLDQIYLASRLALLNLISEDKNPVVIMDDPFVTFDKHRRKNALKLLKTLSKKYQILLLTCHDFYDGYEDQLIELPA